MGIVHLKLEYCAHDEPIIGRTGHVGPISDAYVRRHTVITHFAVCLCCSPPSSLRTYVIVRAYLPTKCPEGHCNSLVCAYIMSLTYASSPCSSCTQCESRARSPHHNSNLELL
eukprot:5801819-Pyramimonas_sp.AAC.1